MNDGRKLEKWVYVLHENQEKIADEYFLDFEGDRLVSLDIQKFTPLALSRLYECLKQAIFVWIVCRLEVIRM
ncbi:hypothetical protein [Porphyromonas macacae]|uniref:hypothetical protein n=1 Tax=Porphyromonas macacae TaxID=28115 RepID=UPI000E0F3178|nr:hypothetical protein [Porphyromonas macacae]